MKKKELIFILALLLAAVIFWIVMNQIRIGNYGTISINVYGKDIGTWSLGKDQVIDISDTNKCEIKDGKAYMIYATCPDHICVDQQGPIDERGGMIVCLPNRVIIEGHKADSDSSSGIDSIAQ